MSNNLFEILEIERGITADEFEANDDPGKITSPVWGLGFRIYFDFFFFLWCIYTFYRTLAPYAPCLGYAL